MRIVIASNPFKGSMSGIEVADRIAAGMKAGFGGRLTADKVPIADGGDGTLDAVAASVKAKEFRMKAPDALGRARATRYLIIDGGATAVVEMALVSGLAMIGATERNPEAASTYGMGLLIADALKRGARRVIVGIGGSATNDGGAGMAAALGYRFIGADGREAMPRGGTLKNIKKIDDSGALAALAGAEILVACDVTNPLVGPRGASAVYGPQKGADEAMVKRLDAGLKSYAGVVERHFKRKFRNEPGAGAAGGAGFGLMAFAGARLVSGIDLMIDITGLDKRASGADLMVTGEGRMDSQSAQGKAPFGALKLAKKYGIPAIAFCGGVEEEDALCEAGFTAVFPIVDKPMSLEAAMSGGGELLERAARRAGRLLRAGMRMGAK
jgi:glycerate kinase